MSEQVKPQLVWLPDGLGGGEHVHVYRATDYDDLHAEAEALREERDSFQRVGIRAMEELEAARGLLREAAEDIESWGAYASAYFQEKHDLAGCAMKYRMAGTGDQEDGGAEQAAIAAMPLTATPAPEVQVEQGERQEAIKMQHMAVAEDGVLRWMTGRKIDNCELYAMPDFGCAPSVLYKTPQPGPDVRGLVSVSTNILGKLQHPTASVNAMDMWKLEDALKPFVDNRQAQQGGSHDN